MTLVYVIVFGSAAVLGVSAVYGLVWALRQGQVGDFAAGARSIFDEDEPVGRPTEAVPYRADGGGR